MNFISGYLRGFIDGIYSRGRKNFRDLLAFSLVGAVSFGSMKGYKSYTVYIERREKERAAIVEGFESLIEVDRDLKADYSEKIGAEAAERKRLEAQLVELRKRLEKGMGDYSTELEKDRKERKDFMAELKKIQFPPSQIRVESTIYPGLTGKPSTKEERAKKARILVERMKDSGCMVKKKEIMAERQSIVLVKSLETSRGRAVIYSIEWIEKGGRGYQESMLALGLDPKKPIDSNEIETMAKKFFGFLDHWGDSRKSLSYNESAMRDAVYETCREIVIDFERDGEPDGFFRDGMKRELEKEVVGIFYNGLLDSCLQAIPETPDQPANPKR